jgi:glycosyltransferase involved in cell wall biosynthesis
LGLLLYPSAFASLRVDADVVLCSTSGFAHAVQATGVKLVYCHNPPRWLYDEARHYLCRLPDAVQTAFAAVAPSLRTIDRRAARTADAYFANSKIVVSRIREAYGMDAEVFAPPVTQPSTFEKPIAGIEPGFVLCASRLLPYKNIDEVVRAFAILRDERLVVVGEGPLRQELNGLATPNVTFTGPVKGEELAWLYRSCAGLVAASREDFGLTPLEAASYGRPSAVLRFGGFLETVVDGETGVYFDEPEPQQIAKAVTAMLRRSWDTSKLMAQTKRFSEEQFVSRLRSAVASAGATPRVPQVALVAHDIHDHGGMERACAELVRSCHTDVRFTVVSSQLAPELRPLVHRWIRIPIPQRPMPLKFLAFYVLAGLRLLRLRRDVTHTVGALIPNRADIASVHFCHAGSRAAAKRFPPTKAPLTRRVNTAILDRLALVAERWSYRRGRVKTLAAVSTGVAAEVGRFYPGVDVAVTPNGVDAMRFAPDKVAREDVRAAQGVGDELVLVFVGGDWDRKGLALAIEALAIVRPEAPCRLWVVGRGDADRFGGIAARLGVSDAVTFFGSRSDTERYCQAADVFVLPSQYETFSLGAFEAASCGLPLVITKIHTATELVGDEEAGFVVEPEAAAIATAIKALTDDSSRARMGRAARRRALGFTWEESASSVARLYGIGQ